MAGKHYSGYFRSRSPILVFIFSLLALSLLFYLFSFFSSPSDSSKIQTYRNPQSVPNPKPDYSFVTSLDKFLTSTSKFRQSGRVPDDTVSSASDEAVNKLDDMIRKAETERLDGDSSFPVYSPLRVYVYEMPPKFTCDLLGCFGIHTKKPPISRLMAALCIV